MKQPTDTQVATEAQRLYDQARKRLHLPSVPLPSTGVSATYYTTLARERLTKG